MSIHPLSIKISDFDYLLPEEKIAFYPLPERDMSKLLMYQNGEIRQDIFRHIIDYLPKNSLLVFNETKVVHARIVFFTENGQRIEIFCLEPESPKEIIAAFAEKQSVVWKCFIGNNRKWKSGESFMPMQTSRKEIHISRLTSIENAWLVKFEWNNGQSFSEILEEIGKVPLPPYIQRDVEKSDEVRYQAVFAKNEGSVAAPTASLHFTETLVKQLAENSIETCKLTLHVGAGTFKPVNSGNIANHKMHSEKIVISGETIQKLKKAVESEKKLIPVGTTAMRSLESLYWWDVSEEKVAQFAPYSQKSTHSPIAKLTKLYDFATLPLSFSTSLLIAPGYKFKYCSGLITNFHQPKSTLLLLVAALLEDKCKANSAEWRKIYNYALNNNFRFLSYGDACLFL
ncbi:MAG: tRNA preQ1(34) S-adenosylmethionine ribosyltransferase-isomerase QueA [Bacteroidales bacterium]|jgi:S-adenosylmethionine:tRNA ribosyltransferase-isomerase|nr:tRNA preQ1(34) S-adenosylmethionine ribosyltransferase-isomerase QueA [Bacteroidales bacterium]